MLSARVNPLGYQSMSVVGGINKDCETELEEMNGHVCEQHQISDGHIQSSARLRVQMPTGVLPDEVCGNCPAATEPLAAVARHAELRAVRVQRGCYHFRFLLKSKALTRVLTRAIKTHFIVTSKHTLLCSLEG